MENSLNAETWKILLSLGLSREYNTGEVIYLQDESGLGLVCLEQGRIKNCVLFPDGTEKILCILDAPTITGETAVIDGGTTICTAVALSKTRVVFIPRDEALKFLHTHPNVVMLILNTMAKKMRSMQIQAQDMAANIPQRLARMLINCNKYGVFTHKEQEELLIITHDDLASFLGTTRPKITEHLNNFLKNGLIEKGRGYIKIKNSEALKRIAQSGY